MGFPSRHNLESFSGFLWCIYREGLATNFFEVWLLVVMRLLVVLGWVLPRLVVFGLVLPRLLPVVSGVTPPPVPGSSLWAGWVSLAAGVSAGVEEDVLRVDA